MMQLACYGRLGADPKALTTKSGKSMAVASLAVTLVDRDGNEHTQWIGIVAWDRAADVLVRSSKGELISVSGRAQMNSFTKGTGETRNELQVIADSVVSARSVRPSGGKAKAETGPDEAAPFNDEIPF